MKCPGSVTWSKFQTGALPRWSNRRLLSHLSGCRHCQAELEALNRTDALLSQLPAAQVPGGMWFPVAAKLPDRPRLLPAGQRWRPVAVVAAACLAVVLLLARPGLRQPPASPAEQRELVISHHLLSVQDPLADRAGTAVMLAGHWAGP